MARKTLKQKLRAKLRVVKSLNKIEHELAGITINNECQKTQAIAMAHGLMATLLSVKHSMGVDAKGFDEVEKLAQGRIAQCMVQLVSMGMSAEEANNRIMAGH
ncbi:hypothetical protein Erwinia_phage_Aioli_00015 [Erwinia phage Aioli]|nr:hypothetical protein Erwinia_phage_Aioli_00015 [Erwinia phage Aioli]